MAAQSSTEDLPRGSAGLLAADLPELEFTETDQHAHEVNSQLASQFMTSFDDKISEIGIINFWNTPNLANDSARTQWQYMMKLPALSIAVASKQCKQGWMRSAQESAEKLSEEMQLVTWRAAASRLFTVADPLSLAGEGLPPAEDKAADKGVGDTGLVLVAIPTEHDAVKMLRAFQRYSQS